MKLSHFLIHEIKELASRSVYFLVTFSLVLVILKLFLEDYSIEFFVLSKIAVGSLIAAKAVLIADQTGMSRRRTNRPRYINVLSKTFFYTLIAVIFSFLEAFIRGIFTTKSFSNALETAIHEKFTNSFIAVTLLLIVIFLVYNVIDEINLYLGEGKLKKFFFSNPKQQ